MAFARALNDWDRQGVALDRDARLRASIIVPMQNAELAVDEINRCAADRRFVQVMLLVGSEDHPRPAGQNWADLCRRGAPRPACRHPTPAACTAIRWTPVGWAHQLHRGIRQPGPPPFQSQLTSLIAEGVLRQIPRPDGGADGVRASTWLPAYLWRLTKFWKGLRSEIPWVSDPPSSIVRDRVRLTFAALRCAARSVGRDAADRPHRIG